MLGLAVLFVMAIYFVILFFVTRFCYKKTINKGKNRKVAFLFGLLGFSLVFLPVFWDYIPNRIYFNDLCKNDTQLQVYKTFDEWNTENPGVLETLTPFSNYERDEKIKNDPNYSNRVFDGVDYCASSVNQRLIYYKSCSYYEVSSYQIRKRSFLLFDINNQMILAKSNNVFSGPGNYFELGGNSIKVWLNKTCTLNNYEISGFAKQFKIFKE